MKKQGIGNREQGTERPMEVLLRHAVPPVAVHGEGRDLWPEMVRKLRSESVPEPATLRIPWFDWALAGGLIALLLLFPAWIPVLLYYL